PPKATTRASPRPGRVRLPRNSTRSTQRRWSMARLHIDLLMLVVLAVPAAAHPPGETSRRTDRYGDPLPEGAIARLGTARFRNGYFHFSPDGKVIALSDWAGGPIRLCDAATGMELRVIHGEGRNWHRFGCFSPDGRMLATAGMDGSIWLWATADGK